MSVKLRKVLDDLFTADLLDAHPGEWGIADHCPAPSAVGYATTITPQTIDQAIARGVDTIATHHDAWTFMFEQRDEVQALLAAKRLTHVWAHLPLDRADFGTAASLLAALGCADIRLPADGEARCGQLPAPADLASVRSQLDELCAENPRALYDAGRPIRRIGCVTGAGTYTSYIRDLLAHGIDLYITGETNLYLLEYARYHRISVAVYSHNYTELPGVRAFAEKLCRALGAKMHGHLGDAHF